MHFCTYFWRQPGTLLSVYRPYKSTFLLEIHEVKYERHFSILGCNGKAALPEMIVTPVMSASLNAQGVQTVSVTMWVVVSHTQRAVKFEQRPSQDKLLGQQNDSHWQGGHSFSRDSWHKQSSMGGWTPLEELPENPRGLSLILFHHRSFLHVCSKWIWMLLNIM